MSGQGSIDRDRCMFTRTKLSDAYNVGVGAKARIKSIPPGEGCVRPQAHLCSPCRPDLDRFAYLNDLVCIGLLELREYRFERVCLAGASRSRNDENAAFLRICRLKVRDLLWEKTHRIK